MTLNNQRIRAPTIAKDENHGPNCQTYNQTKHQPFSRRSTGNTTSHALRQSRDSAVEDLITISSCRHCLTIPQNTLKI
jgi:hypothetical protein